MEAREVWRRTEERKQKKKRNRCSAFPRGNVRSRNGHFEGGEATGMLLEGRGNGKKSLVMAFFFIERVSLLRLGIRFVSGRVLAAANEQETRGQGRRCEEKRGKMRRGKRIAVFPWKFARRPSTPKGVKSELAWKMGRKGVVIAGLAAAATSTSSWTVPWPPRRGRMVLYRCCSYG